MTITGMDAEPQKPQPIPPCCFCGQPVDELPTTLMVSTPGVTKTWLCHAACYEERLGELLPEPWSLYEGQ